MTKPGYQTTEFWLALIAQAVPLLVLLGVFSPDESEVVQDGLTEAVKAGGAFLISLGAIWKYIESRTAVKTN